MTMHATSFTLRAVSTKDHPWLAEVALKLGGGEPVVTPSGAYSTCDLPGFVAERSGERAGLISYRIDRGSCEIVALLSLVKRIGIGTSLVEAVRREAERAGCRRLWLVTTNDNLAALRFYQKRGFALCAIHRDAMDAVRAVKPEVPATGREGIPLRDMIELEMAL